MIETLQALPLPAQVLFAVLVSVIVVASGIIVYIIAELETDDYWRKL